MVAEGMYWSLHHTVHGNWYTWRHRTKWMRIIRSLSPGCCVERTEIFAAVLLNVKGLWHATLCYWASCHLSQCCRGSSSLEEKDNTVLWNLRNHLLNLYAPRTIYIGQTYRYSTEYTFYIFSQQIYLIVFLDFLSPSLFIPSRNVAYFLMLPFLVHKIFTFYVNGVLNCINVQLQGQRVNHCVTFQKTWHYMLLWRCAS